MSARPYSRPKTGRRACMLDVSRPSQRLAAEASLRKTNPSENGGGLLQLPGEVKLTRSAVGFEDARHDAAKDSIKKQKQAWESPPSTPQLPRLSTSPGTQRRMKKVQDFLYPDHLLKLKEKFQNMPGDLKGKIDLDEFIDFFRTFPELKRKSDEEIKIFFDKIDCYSEGQIDWDDICTYMYLELYEKDDAQLKAKKVVFNLPATPVPGPHKDSLCKLCYLQDGSIVSCSQDGVVCFWTLGLKPKRIRRTETGILGKPKWISDMAPAPAHGKIILTTGDNEIQFFEMINFEPYCQITNLECTPLKLDFWSNPDNNNECILLVGDEQGTVTILCIPHMPDAFKLWKLGPKKNGIPSYLIDGLVAGEPVGGVKVYRWQLHTNWVSDLRYFGQLRVFASSASDSNSSLVMGSPSGSTPVDAILQGHQYSRRVSLRSQSRRGGVQHPFSGYKPTNALVAKNRLPGDQKVFKVTKGMTTFDFCQKNNVLVTGGRDQVIRIWNPFVTAQPIGTLYGQGSPVFSIKVDSINDRIYSVSNDNTVKVWDLIEQNCLCTLISAQHKVYSTIEAMLFNSVSQTLILATEQLFALPLSVLGGIPVSNIVYTHRQSVTAMAFSDTFELLITASAGSDIKVWELLSGECVFEFASVHGDSPITAIDIDASGRRLVTAGENGEIKLWNFNNGQCLLTLNKGNSQEVSAVKFVSVNQIKYVAAVGWDRRVNVFSDLNDIPTVQSVISPIPAWSRSTSHVHQEDITCITSCPPTMLATASFDGEIILWSIISGYLMQRLKSPIVGKLKSISKDEGDCTILKLIFLDKRKSRTAASLIASGPAGYIHFWNIHDCKKPLGTFQATQFKCVTDMSCDLTNTSLITADIEGFVSLWDIKNYCIDRTSSSTPKCIMKWRAHAATINSLILIEDKRIVLTASTDNSVRVWNKEGHYIGTLGQSQLWHLGATSTYQHPMAPQDVLIDPLTIPKVNEEESDMKEEEERRQRERKKFLEDIEDEDSSVEKEKRDEDMLTQYGLTFNVPMASNEIEETEFTGKRLRHLRTNSATTVKRWYQPPLGSYASLLYQDLEKEPLANIGTLSSNF